MTLGRKKLAKIVTMGNKEMFKNSFLMKKKIKKRVNVERNLGNN